jgi:hypothetical protein
MAKNIRFEFERKSPRPITSATDKLKIERFLEKMRKAEIENLGKKKTKQLKHEIWSIYNNF